MADAHFGCTICGKCCRDLRLPLSLAEADAWLGRGHRVEVLCKAIPWPDGPASQEPLARYEASLSVAASSGALPVRIGVILAAPQGDPQTGGPCPNLRPDGLCAIYDDRPMVCRIYPAEFNPFIPFDPAGKLCPPEAWAPSNPVRFADGQPLESDLSRLIARYRATAAAEVAAKAALCARLGIRAAGLSNEGFVVHRPDPDALRQAVRDGLDGRGWEAVADGWGIVSNRASTLNALRVVQASAIAARSGGTGGDGWLYLGLFPDG